MREESEIREDLAAIARTIADAEAAAAAGTPVNLTGLQEQVEVVCRELTALPAERAKSYEPALAEMIAALDRLGGQLQAQDGDAPADTPDGPGQPAAHKRAAAAYGRGR